MASELQEPQDLGLEDDTVHVLVIDRPSEATINEAIDMFCAAFANDPPARAFTGGNPELMHDLGRAVLSPLRGSARLYAATDAEGELVGASFWTPPGKPDREAGLQRESALQEFLGKLPEDTAAHVGTVLGKMVPKLFDEAVGMGEAEVHCYECDMLIVRPDHQGHGIARKMFEFATHQADAMNAKMLLWTGRDVNVKVYEKLGMTLRSSTDIKEPTGEDWTLHVLMREPVAGSP
ncbi:hypothetical protein PENSPDRAFT_650174 [Peniophora sp. CONT]|nr:hypothetical protein PENSPDRAFT_650174 [Peniophora sp. CONT]